MTLRLVFLGKLADLAGGGDRALEVPAALGWPDLLGRLDPDLAAALAGENVRVACNGVVVADKTAIRAGAGDELAFLPPVSGG